MDLLKTDNLLMIGVLLLQGVNLYVSLTQKLSAERVKNWVHEHFVSKEDCRTNLDRIERFVSMEMRKAP